MRSFFPLLILFAISFNVLRAELGIATLVYAERVYTPAFPCIAQNFGKVVFRIDGYQNFVDDFIGLRDANFTAEIDGYVDLQTDQSDIYEYCTTILESLPNTFSGTIWLQPNVYNLTNVEEIVVACKQQGLNMGIYTESNQWAGNFGNTSVSSPILSVLPLWYIGSTNTTDFTDFTAFGGWTAPTMKNMAGGGATCNNWVNFSNGYYLFYYE